MLSDKTKQMNYKTDAKYLPVIIIGLSVLYQCLCAIQGFDLTDEGHLMSAYQYSARIRLPPNAEAGIRLLVI